MAKRTRLTAPSTEELAALDAEFRSENPVRPNPATAPIASVAAESAALSGTVPAQQRLDQLDADALRQARSEGRLIEELPINQIETSQMVRDRVVLDDEALEELATSIADNGLRLPIEVYAGEGGTYHLLSGYRRLEAVRRLDQSTIKALVRPKAEQAAAFVAMVEENEVRENLSHYERGRIAVLAAQQGAFASTDDAVKALFATSSAAKRSKVKSFAEVFSLLGDLMRYPEDMSERRGLRVFNAIRQGALDDLRNVLGAADYDTPEAEWAQIEAVLDAVEAGPVKVARRGRKPVIAPLTSDVMDLKSGISLRKVETADGFQIAVSGRGLTPEVMDEALDALARFFDKSS